MAAHKYADPAKPWIGAYEEVERILPTDYRPLLDRRQTQHAIHAVKRYVEDRLCEALNLFRVEAPLIVSRDRGVNDDADLDGSRTPVEFRCGLGLDRAIPAQVVQSATKWKRMALRQFDCKAGEGICADVRAVRKDDFLDHDHSAYVDQWDWERAITPDQRSVAYLEDTVRRLWEILRGAEGYARREFPALRTREYPDLPDEVAFVHAEDLLEMYPDLPRKERETRLLEDRHAAAFIIGIGWELKDGHPHGTRPPDCDDWATPTTSEDGRPMHGLNGDLLVWNPVTRRRHELASIGIRVTKESLRRQLELTGRLDLLDLPYHRAILKERIPPSIGGGIGQSRTVMLLLRKAHIGEVSVSVWPRSLKEICERKNIRVLE